MPPALELVGFARRLVNPHARRSLVSLCILGAFVLVVLGVASPILPAATTGQSENFSRMLFFAGVALVFSFLCSVAEAVLLSISPAYLATRAREGNRSARMLQKVKKNIDRSLAGILTLNTIAHTVGAGGAGAEAALYFGDQYVGAAMAVLTLLILFLSEIVPKTIGAVYWRQLAFPTAWFTQLLTWVLYPLIWVSEKLTRLITGGQEVHALSRAEIAAMAQIGEDHGQLDARESRILRNLFRFDKLRVKDIMTPRTVVFTLQEDLRIREVVERHPDLPFSRIPIYAKARDDITGFVLKVDLLLAELQGRGEAPVKEVRRAVRAVSESASLVSTTDMLLDERVHLLVVFDDYGSLAGVVTLEDVVETLIGIEIVDEVDKIDDMRTLARRKWHERMERLGADLEGLGDETVDRPGSESKPPR